MVTTTRRRSRVAALTLALTVGFIAPLVGVGGISTAEAVPICIRAGSDGRTASASCTRFGEARINVTCNALFPFSGWTDYGTWTSVNGGRYIMNSHALCASSLTLTVQRR